MPAFETVDFLQHAAGTGFPSPEGEGQGEGVVAGSDCHPLVNKRLGTLARLFPHLHPLPRQCGRGGLVRASRVNFEKNDSRNDDVLPATELVGEAP